MGQALARSLTDSQERFVACFVANGGNRQAAAREAGYSDPRTEGYRLLQLPHVQQSIFNQRERHLQGEMGSLAMNTILALMESSETPASVRFQAAKWVLEVAGHCPGKIEPEALPKGLHEMSLDELKASAQQYAAVLDVS